MNKPLPPATFGQILPPNENYTYFEDKEQHPFRHAARDFELVNAAWLADFALLAYGDETFIGAHLNQAGLTAAGFAFRFFTRATTQCFVAHNEQFVVLSLRGTQVDNFWSGVLDLALDLNFALAPDASGGLVHTGFQQALGAIWQTDLKAHLAQLLNDGTGRTLWITGHSLGAALATLAAERAAREGGFDVRGIYTYASPRVGDASFKQSFAARGLEARTYRFVNDVDVVPKVPPPVLYTHTGQFKYIDAAGHIHALADEAAAGLESHLPTHARAALHQLSFFGHEGLALLGHMHERIIPAPLADHAPIYYASYIWNNL